MCIRHGIGCGRQRYRRNQPISDRAHQSIELILYCNCRQAPSEWRILPSILSMSLLTELHIRERNLGMLELGLQPDSKYELLGTVATRSVNLKRIEARDRRLAAMHEAGHHTMACHRGMEEVESWIERVGDPTRYHSSWGGHCRWRHPSAESSRTDTMIGIAGMVAESLWKAGNERDCMDNIYDLLDDPNCMSESDWRTAGLDCDGGWTDTQCREIEAVIDLLSGPLLSEFLGHARRLIIESRDIYVWGG